MQVILCPEQVGLRTQVSNEGLTSRVLDWSGGDGNEGNRPPERKG